MAEEGGINKGVTHHPKMNQQTTRNQEVASSFLLRGVERDGRNPLLITLSIDDQSIDAQVIDWV